LVSFPPRRCVLLHHQTPNLLTFKDNMCAFLGPWTVT
jgi:hypothetical protein